MVFVLSVLNRIYNFAQVCPNGKQKLYLIKITSVTKFCDLNKTRFFYNFLKMFKFAAILHTIRLSLLSEYDVL